MMPEAISKMKIISTRKEYYIFIMGKRERDRLPLEVHVFISFFLIIKSRNFLTKDEVRGHFKFLLGQAPFENDD